MKHYAGLDLSMETTAVCVVDETGLKVHAETVESTPEAIAEALERCGQVHAIAGRRRILWPGSPATSVGRNGMDRQDHQTGRQHGAQASL